MKLHPITLDQFRAAMGSAPSYTPDAKHGPIPTARFCSRRLRVSMTDSEAVTTAKARKILVVDDDVTTARALRVILKDAGYEPTICHAGNEALQRARADHPHAAMIDVHLPDLSGLILAQQIRQIVGKDIPIIMVSGDTSMETLNSLQHVGATYFLSKPLNRKSLVEWMKEWIP